MLAPSLEWSESQGELLNDLVQVACHLATATSENFLPGIMSWNVKKSFIALLLKEDKERSSWGAFFATTI